jgi:predicted RNase H-like HicB family nuclease
MNVKDDIQRLDLQREVNRTSVHNFFEMGSVSATPQQIAGVGGQVTLQRWTIPRAAFADADILLRARLSLPHRQVIRSHFTAVYEQDDGWWIAHIEEMPNVLTQGRTLEEAQANLKEAFTLVLETQREMAEEEIAGRDVVREEFIVRD